MKILLLVERDGYERLVRACQARYSSGHQLVTILFSRLLAPDGALRGVTYRALSDYGLDDKTDFIEQFNHVVERNAGWSDPAIRQCFEMEGVSFLDLEIAELSLYFFAPLVRTIDALTTLFQAEQPDGLILQSTRTLFGQVAWALATDHGIALLPPGARALELGRGAARLQALNHARHWRDRWLAWQARRRYGARPVKLAKQPKHVFVCFVPGHVDCFIPPIKALRATHDQPSLVVFPYTWAPLLEPKLAREGIPFAVLETYLGSREQAADLRSLGPLRRQLDRLLGSQELGQVAHYRGRDMTPVIARTLREVFLWQLPKLAKDLAVAKLVLSQEKALSVTVADECHSRARAFVKAAHILRLPSYHIQQGSAQSYAPEWNFVQAEKVAVMGEFSRRAVLARGVPEQKLVLTGQPRYDRMASMLNQQPEIGPPPRNTVLFATIPPSKGLPNEEGGLSQEEHRFWVKTVLQEVSPIDGVSIILKPHPQEEATTYEGLLAKLGYRDVEIMPAKADILPAMAKSDVLLTWLSMTALEGVILGKVVIEVNFTQRNSLVPLSEAGVALAVRSPQDLRAAVEQALRDPQLRERLGRARQAYLAEHVYRLDGKAGERIADMISQSCQEKVTIGTGS